MKKPCERCEVPPVLLPDAGTLFLSAPEAGTLVQLKRSIETVGLEHASSLPGLTEVNIAEGTLEGLATSFTELLSTNQLRDTKCLYLAPGEVFNIQALFHMQPLLELVYRARSRWLVDMLSESRFVTFFQPIVSATDPSQIFAYESLLRGRMPDGNLVFPGRILEFARAGDMLFQIDRAARLSAISCAAKHGIDSNVFINFTPTSVYDPAFCLQTTVEAINTTKFKSENIVFEVIESESLDDIDHVVEVLQFYRDNGYRIALDDLGAGYSSLNLLTRLRPDFIKLDMGLIRNVHEDTYKSHIARMLLQLARELGTQSIAEGVETVDEWQWLRENGADYIQGYLFGKPSEIPQPPHLPQP